MARVLKVISGKSIEDQIASIDLILQSLINRSNCSEAKMSKTQTTVRTLPVVPVKEPAVLIEE